MKKLIIDNDEFKRLYLEELLSCPDIATKFGCSLSFVKKHVTRLGLVRDTSQRDTANRRKQMLELIKDQYKGDDHPRVAGKFKHLFSVQKCGWIRCPDPTAKSDKWDVDHNHDCIHHRRDDYANKSTACRYCVRTYVHHRCNIIIEHWEWAQREGLPIPTDVTEYLEIGTWGKVGWVGEAYLPTPQVEDYYPE